MIVSIIIFYFQLLHQLALGNLQALLLGLTGVIIGIYTLATIKILYTMKEQNAGIVEQLNTMRESIAFEHKKEELLSEPIISWETYRFSGGSLILEITISNAPIIDVTIDLDSNLNGFAQPKTINAGNKGNIHINGKKDEDVRREIKFKISYKNRLERNFNKYYNFNPGRSEARPMEISPEEWKGQPVLS